MEAGSETVVDGGVVPKIDSGVAGSDEVSAHAASASAKPAIVHG